MFECNWRRLWRRVTSFNVLRPPRVFSARTSYSILQENRYSPGSSCATATENRNVRSSSPGCSATIVARVSGVILSTKTKLLITHETLFAQFIQKNFWERDPDPRFLKTNPNKIGSSRGVQSLFTQTRLGQSTMASTWPVNNFANISEKIYI